jgi:hypothetical protein
MSEPAPAEDDRALLRPAMEALNREFGEVLAEEMIESYVSTSYGEILARSRFDTFAPLLAERQARRELRQIAP